MGDGAAMKLRQNGIRVIRGASGPVGGVIASYLAGNLADSQETCTAHGHECLEEIQPSLEPVPQSFSA